MVVGDAVTRGGLTGATAGLALAFGGRVLDLPVADRAALAFALGLSWGGKRVVVEVAATSRLPALAEVLEEAGRAQLAGEYASRLVVRIPYGRDAGPPFDGDLRCVIGLAGWTVVCAADATAAVGLLRAALRHDGPVLLLEPRSLGGERARADVPALPLQKSRILRPGRDLVFAAWGDGVQAAGEAAMALADEGIEAAVLDLSALVPLDRQGLGEAVRQAGRLVVLHDEEPALAAEVHRVALEEAFVHLESPLAAGAPSRAAELARASMNW